MMSRRRLIQTSAAGMVGATALRLRFAKEGTQMSSKNGYASVNGLNLYYEIHGVGEPLILLHGGLGSIDMFGEVLPLLAKGRQVIAVDLQGHGRTADIDRPIRYELMADDIAALIKFLKLPKADVMGYSLGAGTAIRTAIQHPDKVRKLVVVSSPCTQSGWYPEVVATMKQLTGAAAEMMKPSPIYKSYAAIAPKPENFAKLIDKVAEMLRQDYDWSKEVAALKPLTMLVFADADAVRTAHAVEFYELLGGGKRDAGWDGAGMSAARLAILPGLTHYNMMASAELASTVAPFLDAAMPGTKVSQGL